MPLLLMHAIAVDAAMPVIAAAHPCQLEVTAGYKDDRCLSPTIPAHQAVADCCGAHCLTRMPPLPQWHAYGHGIRNLASAAAQAADGIALYYNSEAAEVVDAAKAAGTATPPMLRIMPATLSQAEDALQVGLSIQVRRGAGEAVQGRGGTCAAAM